MPPPTRVPSSLARFGDFSFGGTDCLLGINWGQLVLVGEPQRFTGLPCVRPVADHLWRVAGLGVFSARAFMIVIAGRSLAPTRVGRTPGLCHALAVELLLGLFGF